MRKLLLFILMPFNLYSQNPEQVEGLYESIQTTFKEAVLRCGEIENENIVCREKLVSAILLDVFKYYDLESTYSSDLKKSAYKETQDYKEKLRVLNLLKSKYISHTIYLELNKNVNFSIGDYDLKKGGFNVYLDDDYIGYGNDKERLFGHREPYYLFTQLPVKRLSFFFPVNKKKALEIENSIAGDVKFIFLFKPVSVVKIKSKRYFNYMETFIITDSVEVVILNSATSSLYFNKSYYKVKEAKRKR